MERSRNRKKLVIFMLMFSIASLSIGFAAFSATLNISSNASITPNSDTFSVKFSSEQSSIVDGQVQEVTVSDGASAGIGIIDNSHQPTVKNLSANFTKPGQSVQYTVYIRNTGEYQAYLNSVNFLGEKVCSGQSGATESLVQSACESINMYAWVGTKKYTETTSVTGTSMVPARSWMAVRITLEYTSSGTYADGEFSVTFPDLALVYSTIDDPTIEPTITKIVNLESGDLVTPGSEVSIGDEMFYVVDQENNNVKLLRQENLDVGTVPFATTSSFPSYEGSNVETYVNEYKEVIQNLGVNVTSARIITYEELEKLGCQGNSWTCKLAYPFVYSQSYWTTRVYDSSCAWAVFNSSKGFDCISLTSSTNLGVRPLLEIPITEF